MKGTEPEAEAREATEKELACTNWGGLGLGAPSSECAWSPGATAQIDTGPCHGGSQV